MPTALAKPRTTAATAILAGDIDDASGAPYTLKVQRMQLRFFTRVGKTTGDGDVAAKIEHNGLLQCQGTLHGFMHASVAIGITNMFHRYDDATGDAATNPTSSTVTVRLTSARTFVMTLFVAGIQVEWQKEAPYIPVTIQVVSTDTTITEA